MDPYLRRLLSPNCGGGGCGAARRCTFAMCVLAINALLFVAIGHRYWALAMAWLRPRRQWISGPKRWWAAEAEASAAGRGRFVTGVFKVVLTTFMILYIACCNCGYYVYIYCLFCIRWKEVLINKIMIYGTAKDRQFSHVFVIGAITASAITPVLLNYIFYCSLAPIKNQIDRRFMYFILLCGS